MALQPLVREFERGADRANGYRDGSGHGVQWIEREGGEGVSRMEEDTELEEGEAFGGGRAVEDLDSRFGYLDTKIEAVLGHCQKEFQGSLFPDRLGSKYGGYGTFLPTHVRGATVLAGPPPQPVDLRPRPGEGLMERARRIPAGGSGGSGTSTVTSDRLPKISPNDLVPKSHAQLNGVSYTTDGFTNAVQKGSTATKDSTALEQKKGKGITLRISLQKQGVAKDAQKAMYNGFGLDHSSSPSADGDQDDDPLSDSEDESPDRSPWDMIRIMTSHQLPRGGLLSPLLSFLPDLPERKEKSALSMKSNRKQATGVAVKPEFGLGPAAPKAENEVGKNGKTVKDRKEKVQEKVKIQPNQPHQPQDSTKVGKKEPEIDRRTWKEGGTNVVKASNKVLTKDGPQELELKVEKTDRDFIVDGRSAAVREVDNSKDLSRSSRKDKISSTESLKEAVAELPITENKEFRRAKEDSLKDSKKSREPSVEPSLKEIVAKEPAKEKRKLGGNKELLKARKEEDAFRKDVQKQQSRKEKDIGRSVACEVVVDKDTIREVPLDVKRKGKESFRETQSQKELKEKAKDLVKEASKEIKKDSSKKEVSQRDTDDSGKEELKEPAKLIVKDVPKENLKDLVKRDGQDQGQKEGKAGKRAGKKVGKEHKSMAKEKEEVGISRDILVPMGNGSSFQPLAPQPVMPFTAGTSSADVPLGAVLPVQLVLDDWVCCDKCQQWRLLLPGIKIPDSAGEWQCKMMTWLPGLNNCKYPEDVTTAAVYNYLGYQNPALVQANPGLQAQQPVPPGLLHPPDQAILNNRNSEAKPSKIQRSSSKKGMTKKGGVGTPKSSAPNVKRVETGSVKSKSLNDVAQHPTERVLERSGLDAGTTEDVGYSRVMAEKRKLKEKEKEKLKRMWASEGDDTRPQKQTVREEERNRASGSRQDPEWVQPSVKVGQPDIGAEGNFWMNALEPEPSKQQKGRLFQDASKADSSGLKRKKKTESSQENDEPRSGKKSKLEETKGWRASDTVARRKAFGDDGDTRSLQYVSDEDAVQEGESGDRAGISCKNATKGNTLGQPPRNVKVTSSTTRNDYRWDDREDSQEDERNHQKQVEGKCKRNSVERHESSDSEKNRPHKEDRGRNTKDTDVRRKAEPKERDGQADMKKWMKGDDIEADHHTEKRRMLAKNDGKDFGPSREMQREERKVQVKRKSGSSEKDFHQEEFVEEQSKVAGENGKDGMRSKNVKLFDEVSGIARTYVQQSPPERAGDSPNQRSPGPDVRMYSEAADQQEHKGGSPLRSPTSSSSKVSYSARSSPSGSKGGSPIESTVSSSPVRSSKVDAAAIGRRATDDVQNTHATPQSHPSDKLNSVSPSPKRMMDREADAQSDREGAPRQSHRAWDDRPHSSDPERDFRGAGRDPSRDTSSGRAREERYTTSNSREGGDFHTKYDRGRNGRDDDRYWEEDREARAGSTGYFTERYERHRDDCYREREDSVDRYRDRDNRYDRRSREDRLRERDRDRDRDRSRENWPSDRGGDVREERYSRERSVRQDWGRPSSRESRLDKQGSLNWHDEPRQGRDVGREGRDRLEDDNAENKHEVRSNPIEDSKDEHPGEDDHETVPDLQKDDPGHRFEKNIVGAQKDVKSNFLRVPPSGQALHSWEGDRIGVPSCVRKDSDALVPRSGLENQTMPTNVNSRSRVEGQQIGMGSMNSRGKSSQVDASGLDVRIVEGGKQGKEHRKGADEDALPRVSTMKAHGLSGHTTRGTDGPAASPSKKEHSVLAQALIKDAKDLKHSADRMKSLPTLEGESTNLYLQAALKFFQAAHHLEMSATEGVHESMKMYTDTARLCDFCATTYERQRDLAASALSHICAAVARFRVMTSKSISLSKDCVELQNAANSAAAPGNQVSVVQTPPTGLPPVQPSRASDKPGGSHGVGVASVTGESPSSSSASDVDNLNNHGGASDKVIAPNTVKGTALSPLPGSTSGSTDLVPTRLHSNFCRLIRNGLETSVMFESWTKAQIATAAAEAACGGVPCRLEGILAVRKVGEIGVLGNMDAVVRQVRLALEAIGH